MSEFLFFATESIFACVCEKFGALNMRKIQSDFVCQTFVRFIMLIEHCNRLYCVKSLYYCAYIKYDILLVGLPIIVSEFLLDCKKSDTFVLL